MGLRETMNERPWIGYTVVVVLLVAGVFAFLRFVNTADPRSVERLGQMVTVRDRDTGDEWTVNRGRMELALIQQSAKGPLDPKVGLTNPKTGKPSGFPTDNSWEETIKRINEERAAASGGK